MRRLPLPGELYARQRPWNVAGTRQSLVPGQCLLRRVKRRVSGTALCSRVTPILWSDLEASTMSLLWQAARRRPFTGAMSATFAAAFFLRRCGFLSGHGNRSRRVDMSTMESRRVTSSRPARAPEKDSAIVRWSS